jgi:cell division protein FtsL
MSWKSEERKIERQVLGRIKVPNKKESRDGKGGSRLSIEDKNSKKLRFKEERFKKLKEMRSLDRQILFPKHTDALIYLPISKFVIMVGCIIIIVLALFTLTYLAQTKNQLGTDLSRLNEERERLRETNGHLKAKLERLVALEDLELIARESLGLRAPKTGQIIILE